MRKIIYAWNKGTADISGDASHKISLYVIHTIQEGS